jgi:hypothetical protein
MHFHVNVRTDPVDHAQLQVVAIGSALLHNCTKPLLAATWQVACCASLLQRLLSIVLQEKMLRIHWQLR